MKTAWRQRGAFGILYAIMLPVMLGMIGLAVDLAIMFARGHELQALADGAALAAARALDGTQAGLDAARDSAKHAGEKAQYRFLNPDEFDWSAGALSFGATPDGPWTSAESVSPEDIPTLAFAQVDTSGLDAMYGRVAIAFLRIVGVQGEQNLVRRAVAGRKESALGPLAICAMDNNEISMRSNAPFTGMDEVVEFGFRRGVGYNLLNLNPLGSTPKNFIMNPLDFAPAPSLASHMSDDVVRPFVCSGAMPAAPLANGSTLYVREPFPLSMINELNSRFASYANGSVCNKIGSPPDANIIDFRGAYAGFWMAGAALPLRASATPLATGSRLATVADASPLPPGTVASSYGPLWSFSKPLRYVGGTTGAPFTRSDWSKLYQVSSPPQLTSSYSAALSPYDRGLSPHRLSPAPLEGIDKRRILNVPLLQCPVAGNSARVLGIGRFLMTSPATDAPAAIHAEFGGLATFASLTASAVLYK
jgi:hypothetical protein